MIPVMSAGIERLLTEHRDMLYRFLSTKVRDPEDRKDIAQDVFIRVMRGGDIENIENPQAYLLHIAKNLIRDRARQDRSRQVQDHRPAEDLSLRDPFPGPERLALDREALALLKSAILSLPPRRRAAFLLSRVDGLSYKEIAHKLGISQKAVEQHISNALLECRDALSRDRPALSAAATRGAT